MGEKTQRFIRFGKLTALLFFIMVLFSQSVGLFRTGFESQEVLTQFFFFTTAGAGFTIGLFLVFLLETLITEDDSKYGSSVGFVSPGETPALPLFKNFTGPQLFLASLIVFGSLGLFTLFTQQTTFTGVGSLEQQFTAVDNIIFSSALIPASENLGAAFLIAFSLFGLRMIARRVNMGKTNFQLIALFIIPILVGLYGFANHNLRYQGFDLSLVVVFFFWYTGGFITMLTGSFIPFWVMHISNNLFFDFRRFFSEDIVAIYVGIVLTILIAVYIITYGIKPKRRK
jgi:hypothetical protein